MKTIETFNPVIKVNRPQRSDIVTIRFLICCGLTSMLVFLIWFFNPEHVGWAPIYLTLTFALMFKLLKMLHEWYHYWSVSVPLKPGMKTKWNVDVLTTACPGEPNEMIIRTLKAMKAIRYPHINYLCDEGNSSYLKKFCETEGIVYITRKEKTDAKAGNINNALKQATGDICLILDPDHEPVPDFLHRVLPYFENKEIGFVQCVQAYSNQSESIIARGAAEQTYHFYGPMMMCMNSYGTVQAIGANCTFRRSALDSIGGHAAGLSEDMHTAMQLHAKGWKSVYIPEILSRGLVPATLSSYYKQQLKWSRGTFELLFRTFPKLYGKLTWRQKLHYLTIPLYFLYGLVNFIDLFIPVVALALAQVPWDVNLSYFAGFFFPLCGLSLIIRLYSQRWLLEKHEHGFHFTGGLLRTATWWIFLIGFFYTIFKVKVPYIPTPKEDAHQNSWKLSLPNIIMAILTVCMVHYGLSIDWTPYSFLMALYAVVNAGMLSFIVIMSQQKYMFTVSSVFKKIKPADWLIRQIGIFAVKAQNFAYGLLRNGPVALLLTTATFFLSYISPDNEKKDFVKQKETGGFYSGIHLNNGTNGFSEVNRVENKINSSFDIISFDQKWEQGQIIFPENLMDSIRQRNAIPFINWIPVFEKDHDNNKALVAIVHGDYDEYLKKCASSLIKYREPVFISFATEFDNEVNLWSAEGHNAPEEFVSAWQYVYSFFNNLGVSNITWVWCPKNSNSLHYYPGAKFVDWVGVSCLNFGDNHRDNDWYSFSELYGPFHNRYTRLGKPVIIKALGAASGNEQAAWIYRALTEIKEKYKEVKSVVIYKNKKQVVHRDKTTGDTSLYVSDFDFKATSVLSSLAKGFQADKYVKKPLIKPQSPHPGAKNPFNIIKNIQGSPGKFQMMANNRPYYMKGVAYNTAHDWRDGHMPLTRRQLEKDMTRIKEMGANTIRRYDHGMYDRNVLNIAHEFELKVLYGFWFDPKVDYYKDTLMVKRYMNDVEKKVIEFRDHPAVLAWSLGNETWGLLKHTYAKPYLISVRNEYTKMIETLAQRIHELDPSRPVFCCMEHEEYQLPGEIVAMRDGAPSIDAIGINSYYREQISKLNQVTWQFDSLRPYFVSEFGPRGYWDPTYNRTEKGSLKEDSDVEKREWYKEQWINYVEAYRGYNLGGFAYCWHDRMEGSYTWFGLSDYKGRLKPSYYALKEVWTNTKTETLPEFCIQAPASFTPGQTCEFYAVCPGKQEEKLKYEWQFLKDEYLNKAARVIQENSGATAQIKIPVQPSDYRLYLYVSDEKGNVTTTSIPVKVR